MKLLLADDHTLFREALVQFIEHAEPGSNVNVASDIKDVMRFIKDAPAPDLILLDLRMPGMNGLQGLEKVRRLCPAVPVALLSGLAEKQDIEQAMTMGAAGFFPKTMSGRALLDGIDKILQGEKFIPLNGNSNNIMPSYYDGNYHGYSNYTLKEGEQAAYQSSSEIKLTPREKEVLVFLLRGAPNKEIAGALGLKIVTVKMHVRSICRKLGARNRTQAALKAQQIGLIA